MPDTGTGTDPTTDRCPDCGHRSDAECGCSCCGLVAELWAAFAFLAAMWIHHLGGGND